MLFFGRIIVKNGQLLMKEHFQMTAAANADTDFEQIFLTLTSQIHGTKVLIPISFRCLLVPFMATRELTYILLCAL